MCLANAIIFLSRKKFAVGVCSSSGGNDGLDPRAENNYQLYINFELTSEKRLTVYNELRALFPKANSRYLPPPANSAIACLFAATATAVSTTLLLRFSRYSL